MSNMLITAVSVVSITAWLYHSRDNNLIERKDKKDDNDTLYHKENAICDNKIICYKVGDPHPYSLSDTYSGCIYLDYNATTPVYPEVYQSMIPFLTNTFGNPSSSHVFAKPSRIALNNAR